VPQTVAGVPVSTELSDLDHRAEIEMTGAYDLYRVFAAAQWAWHRPARVRRDLLRPHGCSTASRCCWPSGGTDHQMVSYPIQDVPFEKL
jgi:hypothetical protein